MSATALVLVAALCSTQDPARPEPPPPRVAVLPGLVGAGGRLQLARVGLGDGGVEPGSGDARLEAQGRFRTSGGVLVRVLPEGVKLDFPSGGELLVDPRARVHLRDGSQTLPSSSGVRIALLDGVVVDVLPQNGSDLPLRQVEVRDGATHAVLWRAGRALARGARVGAFHGRTLHAFADGRALYEIADVGCSVVLDRVLVPRELARELPPTAVVVLADVLARSLIEIGEIAQQRAADDPRTRQIASLLSSNAVRLFAKPHERPSSARGDLVVPLDAGFRLHLQVPAAGPALLSLLVQGEDVPLCEWTTTNVTRLHLVQRDAENEGKPRYLMRGVALQHLLGPVLGFTPTPTARARARRALAELADGVYREGSVELPVERVR